MHLFPDPKVAIKGAYLQLFDDLIQILTYELITKFNRLVIFEINYMDSKPQQKDLLII